MSKKANRAKFFRWLKYNLSFRWIIVISVILIIATAFLIFQPSSLTGSSSKSIFIIGLVNFNMLLLLALGFVVGRNLIKLVLDRRNKVLGSKLRQRLVFAFVILTLVPTSIMFVFASGLINKATSGWFSPQVESIFDNAVAISQTYVEQQKQELEEQALQIKSVVKNNTLFQEDEGKLQRFLNELRNKYELFSIVVFDSDAFELFSSFSIVNQISDLAEPPISSETLLKQDLVDPIIFLENNSETQFLRFYQEFSLNGERHFIVATKLIPPEISTSLNALQSSHKEYGQLRYFKTPLTASYLLTLALVAGLIMFAAIWFGFYLAKEIAQPLKKVSMGTKEVASGNYDIRLEASGDDELSELIDSFNQMVVDLKDYQTELVQAQKVSAWRDVARRLAHEIKNPLTPIKLSAQRISKRGSSFSEEELQKSTKTIVEHVDTIKVLIDEFSKFARLPIADQSLVDLNKLIQSVMDSYLEQTKDLQVELELSADVKNVPLDITQMRQCLVNLIENAIAAVRSLPEESDRLIKIITKHDGGDFVLLEVSDTGPGISMEDRPRVFDPYFTTKEEGTGLGLSIVASIVADHQGRIRVFDNQPNGTRFLIELPVDHISQKSSTPSK